MGKSKKPKPSRPSKPSRKNLVKELDAVFSIYIRKKNIDENGFTNCYTCGKYDHWKNLQCGHYISRKHFSLRWSELNTRPQCVGCNIFKKGNLDVYALNLMREKENILEDLNRVKNTIVKFNDDELIEMIKQYDSR